MEREILIISDSLLRSCEFINAGFCVKWRPRTPFITEDGSSFSQPVRVHQIVMNGHTATEGFPTSYVTELFHQKGVNPSRITEVLCVIGINDFRNAWKTTAVQCCRVIRQFLESTAGFFHNANIFWLGCGCLWQQPVQYNARTNNKLLRGITRCMQLWQRHRRLPERVYIRDAFRGFTDQDIMDKFGHLSYTGSRKLMRAMVSLIESFIEKK